MQSLCLLAFGLLLISASSLAFTPVGAVKNELITWGGNLSADVDWHPPVFDSRMKCTPGSYKAPFNGFQLTVNGTKPALFGEEWFADGHIYFYHGPVNRAEACMNVSIEFLVGGLNWQALVVLEPGVHSVVVTSVPRNGTTVHSGMYLARLIPADTAAHANNASVYWHPPVFHRPINCQQQESTARPFLHEVFNATESGFFNVNVYLTGIPFDVNVTLWIFEGNFTIVNDTVQNSAKFLTGTTAPGMFAYVVANFTKGVIYTVAVEYDHLGKEEAAWAMLVEPASLQDSNKSQAIFGGVPTFSAKQREVFACAASGVSSKYTAHAFTATEKMVGLDFRHSFANDTIISLYSGSQNASTGCKNFLAAIRADGKGTTRPAPLLYITDVGKNYTIIVSSSSGAGGIYELITMAGGPKVQASIAAPYQRWY